MNFLKRRKAVTEDGTDFSRKEICEALHDTLVNFGGEVSTKIAVLTDIGEIRSE